MEQEQQIIEKIGQKLQQTRLDANLSQEQVAKSADISRRTLVQAETGHSTSLSTIVKILLALKAEDLLQPLMETASISPVELAKLKGRKRQRATGERQSSSKAQPDDEQGDWTW
ncbi:helix-turn-helix transcriptional regulator [Pleionea mediterranea]|uniref:Helix-turn-helix protein n=1 Tax=Pleionea mediterranea TaxID=523701 RepID=A0A316FMH5_9GAMM|nr:helix-turn-helix transcriptional regulator [Pleionea mediterranea]PWK50101.1 helix-turn-helix protein [Pleionea mediterranea]